MDEHKQTGSRLTGFVWLKNFSIIIFVSVFAPDINVFAFSAVFFASNLKILIFGSSCKVN